VKKLAPPIRVAGVYFGFTKAKDVSAFKTQFNQELNRLAASGKLAELLQKHGLK